MNAEHFQAGPKAPAPITARPCEHWQYPSEGSASYSCACGAFSTFNLPREIAAALKERLTP